MQDLNTEHKDNNEDSIQLVGLIGANSIKIITIKLSEDMQTFTVYQFDVDGDDNENSYKPSVDATPKTYPIKLLDHFIDTKKDQGFVELKKYGNLTLPSKFTDIIKNFSEFAKERKDALNKEYVKEKLNDAYEQDKIKKELKKDTEYSDAAGVLTNLASEARKYIVENDVNNFEGTISRINDILSKSSRKIATYSFSKCVKPARSFLTALKEIIDSVKKQVEDTTIDKKDFYEIAPDLATTCETVRSILFNIIKDNFPEYKEYVNKGCYVPGYAQDILVKRYSEKKFRRILTRIIDPIYFVITSILGDSGKDLEYEESISNDEKINDEVSKYSKMLENDITKEESKYKNSRALVKDLETAESIKNSLVEAGVKILKADTEVSDFVEKNLRGSHFSGVKCWKVINQNTEKRYLARLNEDKENANEHLFWHGSVTKNWINIVKNGLSVEFSNFGMFGKGIYFANNYEKSMGYVGARTSKWRRGDANTVYLAIFKVNLGKTFYVRRAITRNTDAPKNCDSVTALAKNTGLRMDEFVIYDDARCTICGIVEIKL